MSEITETDCANDSDRFDDAVDPRVQVNRNEKALRKSQVANQRARLACRIDISPDSRKLFFFLISPYRS